MESTAAANTPSGNQIKITYSSFGSLGPEKARCRLSAELISNDLPLYYTILDEKARFARVLAARGWTLPQQ